VQRLCHIALVLTALVLLFVHTPANVFAHALLVSSDPPGGATLSQAPAHVELNMSEHILSYPASTVSVTLAGAEITSGPPALDVATATDLVVPLQSGLGPGVFVVHWRTVAADDNGVTSGSIQFTVTPHTGGAEAPTVPHTHNLQDIAHGPPAAVPTFALTGSGADTVGSGTFQLLNVGTMHQVIIDLQGVSADQAFSVQLCTVDDHDVHTCVSGVVTTDRAGNYHGPGATLVAEGGIDTVGVVNKADPQEAYTADLSEQPDVQVDIGDPTITPPSPTPPCEPTC
jgi:methionine-rich copper-binding protein CopC